MKFPFLISHYIDHKKEESRTLNFMMYLYEHYIHHEKETKAGEHNHHHEQLPFKHCHDGCTHVVSSAVYLIPENAVSHFNFLLEKYFHDFFQDNLYPQYSHCIWQPPQITCS